MEKTMITKANAAKDLLNFRGLHVVEVADEKWV
jgi:hypothetical protein